MEEKERMTSMDYITHYRQISKLSLRSVARHGALSLLASQSRLKGELFPKKLPNRVQFIYFHHVFKDEEEDFRKLLSNLQSHFTFISYSDGVDKVMNGKIDKPYMTVSFDDGFKNCRVAGDILKELGIQACFFVCTGIVGEKDPVRLAKFYRQIDFAPVELLSWQDIEGLLQGGHEIGSHTRTHQDIAQLGLEQRKDEILGSFEDLSRKIGSVSHFAWPFGRDFHFDRQAAELVFESGYKSCVSAERGCSVAKNKMDLALIRRDLVLPGWPMDHIYYFFAVNLKKALRKPGYSG